MRNAVWLASLSLGCVGGHSADLDAYRRYVAAQDAVYCAAELACCSASEIAAKPFHDQASCVVWRAQQRANGGSLQAALARGTLHFNVSASDRCLAMLRGVTSNCAGPADETALASLNCWSAFTGTTAIGARCDQQDCVAGAHCDAAGQCVALGQASQPCSGISPCDFVRGLACLPSATCGSRLAAGAACNDLAQCSSLDCASDGHCAPPRSVHDTICFGWEF